MGLLSAVGGLVGYGLSKLLKPKKSATSPAALPPVTRDSVREDADRRDALRRRRGGAADMVTGNYGAEASAAAVGKQTLGS